MFLSFGAKKKMLCVLRVANAGVLSQQEISERSNLGDRSAQAALNLLEQQGFLSSGILKPADVKIYRITRSGRDVLATKRIPCYK